MLVVQLYSECHEIFLFNLFYFPAHKLILLMVNHVNEFMITYDYNDY